MTPGVATFGTTQSGQSVRRIAIASDQLSASILTYGAALQDVRLRGTAHSLTVGSPDLRAYEGPMQYCGTIVGPVANRIGNARADIDGQTCHFDQNLGNHILHGGSAGTHAKIWTLTDHSPTHASLTLDLPYGQGGFPGNRQITARYDITATTLRLTLTATTDAATLMNLANHSFWRLDDAPTYSGHSLQIFADHYLPSAPSDNLPTGTISPVANTHLDFRQPRALTPKTDAPLDTNFCLSNSRQPLRQVARLTGTSGLKMDMATTEPGLQVFDGHILNLPYYPSNDGPPHRAYAGLALEAQFWPDAPNNPGFPEILLHPGDDWQQVTSWTFTTPRC